MTTILWPVAGYNRGPIGQVQPFVYSDAISFLELLYKLKEYIVDEIIPRLELESGRIDELYTLVETLDNALNEYKESNDARVDNLYEIVQGIIDNSIIAQDPVVAGILSNPDSATRTVLDELIDNARLNSSRVPVSFFGAVGDGVTDDAPAIRSALASGRAIKLEDGKTYLVRSVLTGDNIDVEAYGATVIVDHSAHAVQMNGVMSAVVPVANWTQASEQTSISGAPQNVVTINCSASVPTSWKKGDVIVVASDDILPYSKDAQTGNPAVDRCGQWLRILSVDGPQIKAAGLVNDPQMLTNLRVAKVETVGAFKWRGGTFDYTDSAYDTGNGWMFFITKHVAPLLRDVTIKRTKSGGVYLRTCHSWLISGMNIGGGVNDLTRNAYGYGVANFNSAFGILSDSYFTGLRHSYTNGGTQRTLADGTADGYGRPHDNLITDCVTESNTASAYDSHTQGRREMFVNCKAYNCSGFFLRGTFHTIKDGVVVGGENGFNIAIESTGDRSYGHTIDGLNVHGCQTIGMMSVNMRTGGIARFQKESQLTTIRNVVAKAHRGRMFIADNMTFVASNVSVEVHDDSTAFSCLLSNTTATFTDIDVITASKEFTSCISIAGNGITDASSQVLVDGFRVTSPGNGSCQYFASGTTINTGFRGRNVMMRPQPTISVFQNTFTGGNVPSEVVFP